jgi:hypothetical protein
MVIPPIPSIVRDSFVGIISLLLPLSDTIDLKAPIISFKEFAYFVASPALNSPNDSHQLACMPSVYLAIIDRFSFIFFNFASTVVAEEDTEGGLVTVGIILSFNPSLKATN